MCIPNNHQELVKELEGAVDNKRRKVLLQLLNTCAICPETQEAERTPGGEPDCSCRRKFATEWCNQIFSFQQEM
ncbi:MAG: hypothetical protein ABR512_14205 [Desulfopila sp.]